MTPSSQSEPGQLLAISVGLPREVEWQGEAVRTGIFKAPVRGPVEASDHGLRGDGQADLDVHGGIDKAVYAFDVSGHEYWREALGLEEFEPGLFGENLTLRGMPENRVRIGDRFEIGSARFEVSQPRQPCMKLGLRFADPSFPKRFFAAGRVGFYLRVLEPGRIEADDPVRPVSSDPDALDVRSLVAIWLDRKASREDLDRALSSPALAEAWREPLRKRRARHSG